MCLTISLLLNLLYHAPFLSQSYIWCYIFPLVWLFVRLTFEEYTKTQRVGTYVLCFKDKSNNRSELYMFSLVVVLWLLGSFSKKSIIFAGWMTTFCWVSNGTGNLHFQKARMLGKIRNFNESFSANTVHFVIHKSRFKLYHAQIKMWATYRKGVIFFGPKYIQPKIYAGYMMFFLSHDDVIITKVAQ